MKVKVIKRFRDKYDLGIRKMGAELDITEERFSEINTAPEGPFVEKVVTESKKKSNRKAVASK